jgi:hypothetical protein
MFAQPYGKQLTTVVPFISRLSEIDAFVTLQANEFASLRSRQRECQRGLSNTGVPFDQERALQFPRQPECGAEVLIGDITDAV